MNIVDIVFESCIVIAVFCVIVLAIALIVAYRKTKFLNKKVIVRGDRSGVFFGTLVEKDGKEVRLENARRIFYWDGAASISQLAVDGTSKPDNCEFTVSVESIEITDVIEIIGVTEKAIKSIENVRIWKA